MDRQRGAAGSLRERKQRRAREAIIEAAHALFEERGFEKVTVSDIAERAEVGRATFFRYFGDKQEVVFADEGELDEILAEFLGEAGRLPEGDQTGDQSGGQIGGPASGPIGDSLPAALALVRAVVVFYVGRLTADPAGYMRHERLVASSPELRARSLTKQRRYAELLRDLLAAQGATPETAALAAEIGMAAYYAARTVTGDDPARLPAAVEAAFDRLT
ncbi:AcrR family transcriptional regulator [Thermocatellispora tengchongensis]|uniref:AcrR family transcriptional regulator n=1 Tax=Thermocatellispora tengchongensis TaxID=1073253 RepID=A0A840PLE4_9ACTN|nr:TetR family transcriptional regulator [Thermocatellispora tengchongensis]MBB5139736.1 AcrR family transcriptional regulator [Thermocatellispora tengchongensis]